MNELPLKVIASFSNCMKDLLISLAVCWKGTVAQGGLHFLSLSVPVFLLQVDIGSPQTWDGGRLHL